jgi:hypothetical protein
MGCDKILDTYHKILKILAIFFIHFCGICVFENYDSA